MALFLFLRKVRDSEPCKMRMVKRAVSADYGRSHPHFMDMRENMG